jgi:hypothetical protein
MLIVRLATRMETIMIESVVALLMFVNAEIKEARLQVDGMAQCLRGKRQAERQYSETIMYKCWKGDAELEQNIDGSKSIKKLIID